MFLWQGDDAATRRHAKRRDDATCKDGEPPKSACTKQSFFLLNSDDDDKRTKTTAVAATMPCNEGAKKHKPQRGTTPLRALEPIISQPNSPLVHATTPCCSAAAKNHKLQAGYYTAARFGGKYFAANPPSPLARPLPNQTCASSNRESICVSQQLTLPKKAK